MNDARRPGRILYRDAALADGRSDRLQLGMSVLVEGERIAWIRPTDGEEEPGARGARGTGGSEGPEAVEAAGLDDGADFIKLYLDGADPLVCPWSVAEIERVVAAVHDAGILRDGGPADFSLVHGDPLSDPTALWRVWRVSWAPEPVVA